MDTGSVPGYENERDFPFIFIRNQCANFLPIIDTRYNYDKDNASDVEVVYYRWMEKPSVTRVDPVHPGVVLKYDFMEPFRLSSNALAKAVGVTPARINEIVRGRRGISAETALRLAKYFNTDAQSWMNLQVQYELALAERTAASALRAIRPHKVA